jgi:hypothetical protein
MNFHMYICELIDKHNYRIVYQKGEFEGSYFGVNTLDRIIFLVNTKPEDTSTVEHLLFKADNQYRGLYNK